MGLFDFFKKKQETVEAQEALDKGLEKTKEGFFSKITRAVVGKSTIDDDVLDNLEEVLVTSDVGVTTTLKIVDRIQKRVAEDKYVSTDDLNRLLKDEIQGLLAENNSNDFETFEYGNQKPYVIMVVGVNGVGKTTTIGKLAHQLKEAGNKVVLGAADTFRAAAVDQIQLWGERVGVRVVAQPMGSDPASVAYDTVKSAVSNGDDVAIIDTAGRLHNKVGLMNELTKIKNVMQKVIPDAPHEILLVLDASTGQNAIEQATQFTQATDVNALALTKLDGTAKGGVVIGISDQFKIPVKYIGVGEKIGYNIHMKTKKAQISSAIQKPRVNVVTLGCSKNIHDSEVLMGQLKGNQLEVVHEASNIQSSDIVVINTCGFIDNAKQESIDTILQFSELKDQGKVNKVIVTGCLSERYKPELQSEIPNVDAFFGTNDLPELLSSIGADYRHELLGERLLTTPSHYSYFKIAEGCNRPCSFCAIPLMRGKHVSKSIDDLVKEAKFLASNGTKELILIAQDLTYYGLDIYGKRNLSDLMRHLSDVDGIEWIRLQYAYPSGFPMDILDAMNERSNICNYLDMPLQHISDHMLTSMRRGTNKQKQIDLVNKIRDKVPDIALRTTLICGYPGETEDDFQEMLEWVEDTRFDRLGCFTYSHEEKTHAYSLEDDVPEEVKQERVDQIMEVQQEISYDINQTKVGKEFKVLVDRVDGDFFIGRTEYDSPEVDNEVVLDAKTNYARIGDFVQVKVDRAEDFDLYGSIVR
ncbi:UNVERIFIED_CONTAM: rimO [Trichonephila clavipes]